MKKWYIWILLSLIICLIFYVSYVTIQKNNDLQLLSDTLQMYKCENGQLVYTKELQDKEIYELKKEIAEIGISKPDVVYKVKTIYSKDTIVVIDSQQIILKDDDRDLEIVLREDSAHIKKDIVYTDFTIAQKKDRIYITPNNSNVIVTNIDGYKIKNSKISFGVNIGIGAQYGIIDRHIDFGPNISVGLNIRF